MAGTTPTSPLAQTHAPVAAAPAWTVRLLGAVEAQGPGGRITHWPSRAVALLLARLALAPDRSHPREALIELLWPGVALDVGRNRLRQALSTLKSLLEGAGITVLLADRMAVRAAPGMLACDAIEFERLLRAGHTDRARQAYRGELMPGHYDDWVLEARGRLESLFERLEALPLIPPAAAAPAPAPPTLAGQLPNHWTRLFGVEINASRLQQLVRRQRLVTVFGAGGSGKTRLAVEAARTLKQPSAWEPPGHDSEPRFDRVAFVSLIDCTDADLALDAIAGALGIMGQQPLARIANALVGQQTLLVLDNFEQLVGRADDAVLQLLTDTATLHLLVTSRQRLGIDGEHVFELAGLALPDAPAASAAPAVAADDLVSSHPAVALFTDRARAARPDFVLGPRDAPVVLALVQLLAGMPLAIELAASRMRSLTPQALLGLLSEGSTPMLDLLARGGSGHSLAQRHASMRHVVDWSWQQLSPPLADLMGALATFALPAHIDTVAAVAALDLRSARDRLEQLRDSSLVVARADAAGFSRYALLQPVREFVLERVGAEAAAQARDRLRHWLVDFAQRCAARGHAAINEVDAELPLIYAAVVGAAADGAQQQAVQIVVTLRRHWEVDTRAGLPLSVLQALQDALPQVTDDAQYSELSALLALSLALAGAVGEAEQLAERALARAPGPRQRAGALLRRANAIIFSGKDLSRVDALLDEALLMAREAGDLESEGLILRSQFLVAVNRDDDHVRAEPLAEQVQSLWERLGHRRNAYSGLMDRASCWIAQGRRDEAATALAACEQVARQERFATGYIMSSWQLGRVSLQLRQADAALAAFRRCVEGSWQHNRLAYVADALLLTPGGLALTGELEAAARLQGFAVAHWQKHFGPFYRDLARDVCFTRRVLRHALGPVRQEALRLEGASLTLPEAVALALGPTTEGTVR
jgi:predicted ATPase